MGHEPHIGQDDASQPRPAPAASAGVDLSGDGADPKNTTARSANAPTTLSDAEKPAGQSEAFEAAAIKEVLAQQLTAAMAAQNLSCKRLAECMNTSRSQIRRLLDPTDGNVTIATLQRAAKVVGHTIRIELG